MANIKPSNDCKESEAERGASSNRDGDALLSGAACCFATKCLYSLVLVLYEQKVPRYLGLSLISVASLKCLHGSFALARTVHGDNSLLQRSQRRLLIDGNLQ